MPDPSLTQSKVSETGRRKQSAFEGVALYISRQADSLPLYIWEQFIMFLFGWIPTVAGIGIRGLFYRLIMRIQGWAAIENNVRLRFASNIRLENGVYLDQNTYLHACEKGIHLGENSIVMHGSVLHVYNFRDLPHAGIEIGKDCLIGEYSVLRGQGGIKLGDRVYTSPFTQILAVNHVIDNPHIPIIDQGITAEGITIEDDVWIGSGVIITDGVHIGSGSVIAAGAVVTGNIPAHVVAAGVPAKILRNIESKESDPNKEIFFERRSS